MKNAQTLRSRLSTLATSDEATYVGLVALVAAVPLSVFILGRLSGWM